MSDNNSKKFVDEGLSDVSADNLQNNKKKPRVGKKLKIFLIILFVLILAIGFLCIRYWHIVSMVANKENIDAYMNSKKYTSEEIESQMEENKGKMEKIAEESPLIQIRGELTEEEVEALKTGEITHEEAKSLVKGEITLEEIRENKASGESSEEAVSPKGNSSGTKDESGEKKPSSEKTQSKPSAGKTTSGTSPDKSSGKSSTGKTSSKTSADKPSSNKTTSKPSSDKTTSKPSEDKKPTSTEPAKPQDKVSEIVSELYVVQADFMNRLEAIGEQAYADYKATSYDKNQIMPIVDSYTATVGALEAECDKKVNTMLKELDAELKRTGEDRSMVKEIRNYYYTEKSLKKSYYMDKLESGEYK